MPVRDAGSTLGQAIRSCLRAMPVESELLLYFDGCTDESLEIANKFDDSRIRKFVESESGGVTFGRKFLVEHAQGTYIATLDADDVCAPWRFSVALRQLSNRNLDFFFSNAIYIVSKKNFLYLAPQIRPNLDPQNFALALAINCPVVHSTMVARRSVVQEIGSYAAARAEDYELYLRASLAGKKMFRYWLPTVMYRKHDTQLSQQAVWDIGIANDPDVVKGYSRLISNLGISLPDGARFVGSHRSNSAVISEVLRMRFETFLRRLLGKIE
jgi:glycosyltransferase involved in cell wall biosynthesis